MKLEQAIDSKTFLQEDWQKNVRVFRKVFSGTKTLISGDELAGLACEDNIESRIVTGSNALEDWQCQFGPFDGFNYNELGTKDWTLLVQSVDHFLPEVREILKYFNFIPKWRLDDVMLSYAPPGGGVGPHFDYYDVFLIQISGSREWKIGQACDESTQLRGHEDMKLLQSFDAVESHQLHAGDMIYIPAGVAHWGTATSMDCITASVGFRAPSYQDLIYSASLDISAQFAQDIRYYDDNMHAELDPYNLSNIATDQFTSLYHKINKDSFINALRFAFAKEVTTSRHQELYEYAQCETAEVAARIRNIKRHPNARFAFIEQLGKITLFANGLEFPTDFGTVDAICHENFSVNKNLDFETITELCRLGYLIIE